MPAPVELLERVPLFEGLSRKQLETLAGDFTLRTFEEGQELTTEGQGAAGFFILESGEAKVTVDGEERRTLKAGDYFGEIALIDEGKRTATITATKAGRAHGLTVWQFRPLVESNASIAWPLLEAMAKRVRQLEQR